MEIFGNHGEIPHTGRKYVGSMSGQNFKTDFIYPVRCYIKLIRHGIKRPTSLKIFNWYHRFVKSAD